MQHILTPLELVSVARGESELGLLAHEQVVWRSMLEGWSWQQASRGLQPSTIVSRQGVVARFRDFVDAGPWRWTPADLEDFTTTLRARDCSLGTIRVTHQAIRLFCEYLTSPHYDWAEICEGIFGETPAQICLPWNTVTHAQDYEGTPRRRALSFDEVEVLFDCADRRVAEVAASGRKGALAAWRDAQMFKTAYVFGLRRAELRGLDLADLHYNAQARQWGQYAALHVRFGKASRGSAPKRRTVLLVPEFAWWVDGMKQWVEQVRPLLAAEDLDALWVTERRDRVSLAYIDGRFASLRDEVGLDPAHTLHSLRHSYVTHLIEYGYADRFVQEQVGHQHASTTSIYTSVSGDFKNRILADAIRRFTMEEEN